MDLALYFPFSTTAKKKEKRKKKYSEDQRGRLLHGPHVAQFEVYTSAVFKESEGVVSSELRPLVWFSLLSPAPALQTGFLEADV